MMSHRILIADDDVELCGLLETYLVGEGFEVGSIHSGAQVVTRLSERHWDLLLLDVMLPDLDGFSALRDLRLQYSVPVLMLTARGDEIDRILGLEMGADDYIAKPCNPRELLARIRAILRRVANPPLSEPDSRTPLCAGELSLLESARRVSCRGRTLELTSAEFAILQVLMRHSGEVVAREQFSKQALGRELTAYDRSVDVHISNLRKKLLAVDAERDWIIAVRGRGYQLLES